MLIKVNSVVIMPNSGKHAIKEALRAGEYGQVISLLETEYVQDKKVIEEAFKLGCKYKKADFIEILLQDNEDILTQEFISTSMEHFLDQEEVNENTIGVLTLLCTIKTDNMPDAYAMRKALSSALKASNIELLTVLLKQSNSNLLAEDINSQLNTFLSSSPKSPWHKGVIYKIEKLYDEYNKNLVAEDKSAGEPVAQVEIVDPKTEENAAKLKQVDVDDEAKIAAAKASLEMKKAKLEALEKNIDTDKAQTAQSTASSSEPLQPEVGEIPVQNPSPKAEAQDNPLKIHTPPPSVKKPVKTNIQKAGVENSPVQNPSLEGKAQNKPLKIHTPPPLHEKDPEKFTVQQADPGRAPVQDLAQQNKAKKDLLTPSIKQDTARNTAVIENTDGKDLAEKVTAKKSEGPQTLNPINSQFLKNIERILQELKADLGSNSKFNFSPKTRKEADRLLFNLGEAQQNLVKNIESVPNAKLDFVNFSRKTIATAIPKFEKDLSLENEVENFLKKVANTIAKALHLNPKRFFTLAQPGSVKAAESAQDRMQESLNNTKK